MGRKVDASLLVGAAEIAERFGLAQAQTVHAWRRRYSNFPEPVVRLQKAFIWYWPDVQKWGKATGRLPS